VLSPGLGPLEGVAFLAQGPGALVLLSLRLTYERGAGAGGAVVGLLNAVGLIVAAVLLKRWGRGGRGGEGLLWLAHHRHVNNSWLPVRPYHHHQPHHHHLHHDRCD
jgi:hypothetical protein